ncbi:MAG: hypothetical protein AB8B58_05130 [Roseobacter sp.]
MDGDRIFQPSVRQEVADVTRQIHNTLHKDAVLSRLMSPQISEAEYFRALTVLSHFYYAVEKHRKRFEVFDRFSLQAECTALQVDLGATTPAGDLKLDTADAVLGALYVAHGASFGRTLFCRNVKTALAGSSHRFVALKVCKTSWRALLAELEHFSAQSCRRDRLFSGALRSFQAVEQLSLRMQDNPTLQ